MSRETTFLRALLVLLLILLAAGCGLLYIVSLDAAQAWPELAHLQLPVYLGVVAGLVPVVVAVSLVFRALGTVARGDAFTAPVVATFRRLKILIGIFIAYFATGLLGFWALSALMHPSLLLAWLALETVALFLFAAASLLERLFAAAAELRQDNELTV